MKLTSLHQILPCLAIAMTVTAGRVHAQFPGDIFFTAPNVVVAQGQTTEVEIQLFAGTSVFGAALFDIVYDPARLQVQEVSANRSGITAYAAVLSNGTSVATFNDESLTRPFGSVNLIRLRVRPLVPAGNTVQLTISSREALDAAGNPFPSTSGFSSTITVVPANATFSAVAAHSVVAGALAPGVDPVHGAVAFRRAGHQILLWEPSARNNLKKWKPRWWQTRNPASPRD